MSTKSLELNWVRGEDKSLLIPEVVFEPREDCGGYYLSPWKGEELIGGRFYDRRFGIIVVSSLWPDGIETTLAHEWRHHWQECNGWRYDGIGWNSPNDYEDSIRDYFTRSRSEADALRFELRKAKSDITDYWRGRLSR